MLGNQGLLAINFFAATAFVVLLVLFFLLRRDHPASYFRLWLTGWAGLTIASLFKLGLAVKEIPELRLAARGIQVAALVVFLLAILRYTSTKKNWKLPVFPVTAGVVAGTWWLERGSAAPFGSPPSWATSALESVVCLWAGWLLWRVVSSQSGHGAKLLAGGFFVYGLNGLDRPLWPVHPLFLLRVAFDHFALVAIGVAMVVLVLERERARSEELNNKMRRLTLLIAASTQTLSVDEVLDRVLGQLVESLGATHGLVRLAEGPATSVQLTARASVGFSQSFLEKHGQVPASEPWMTRVIEQQCVFLRIEEEQDAIARERMAQSGMSEIVALALPGKDGPLGIIAVGSTQNLKFQADEISYLGNVANLLGLTLQNVRLFEQVATVQQQWAYTFDSIGDPILVHDREFRILRSNQRLTQLLGRESSALVGRAVAELLTRKTVSFENCPYCEGVAGEGDESDPWLPGYFLASNSTFTDPHGRQLGTVHVLKDITDRKRAEEKYRTLVSNVQEGVFISTPSGRFLDFNDALMRMLGYEHREELLSAEIPMMYANSSDRDRLKKFLHEHGTVADFEFEIRRRDGELRTMMESSIAVRDAAGNVTAFQGFVLDITDRKRAEQEIRRRNRELMVLNSIAQTLTESMDLNDSLYRTLRQLSELFSLDASSLYLFDEPGLTLRRIAAVGYHSEYARTFPKVNVQPELVQHIKAVRAKFLSAQGLPLPPVFRTVQQKEGIASSFLVILWSKDRVGGVLAVGSRTPRDFSPADINLLIAVGSQIANAIDRTVLYEETRQAYDNLRRTQEQLLHSEKMAAVGQLISGVAHELNNPLTAILGYSQLLSGGADVGPQGIEYADKLYKQAQRTHRIVQNLLSFARQHKPERVPVQMNQILEETLALRDYDLRMKNIRVHMGLAPDLPVTAADPHQLQQVFLNMVNNAVDAVLDHSTDGDIWVRTGVREDRLTVEITDSGPGVRDPSRVFDPFYTTKPVGKGTGLGLSICYGIITEHGGTIEVRNVPPRGACFVIELPFQPIESSKHSGLGGFPSSLRDGRILVIDRDQSVLEAVEAILRGRNNTLRTAKALSEAYSILLEQEFDLVVADLQICSEAGQIGLRAWLLANRPELAARVILMRATAPSVSLGEETRGALQVLQKPFQAGELLGAIETALGEVHTISVER